MFRGAPTGKVDEKGRLKLPAVIRKGLLETYQNGAVFITSLDGEEVRVYPLPEWERVEATLSDSKGEGNPLDGRRKKKILLTANHHGADESLDNQGRILIPGPLREGPGVGSEVRLQWSRNHILVLSAELYDRKMAQAQLDDEDLAYADNLGV